MRLVGSEAEGKSVPGCDETGDLPEHALPKHILQRASLRGHEYAWRVEDIPDVIGAARLSNLISIGGQLQFRLPESTCECYWVEVGTYKSVDKALPWKMRVVRTAEIAQRDFQALQLKYDFLSEGRYGFAALEALVAHGGSIADHMYFVWYVSDSTKEPKCFGVSGSNT